MTPRIVYRLAAAASAFACVWIAACHRTRPPASAVQSVVSTDSLVGAIAVQGTERALRVVIGERGNAVVLHAPPADSAALQRLSGATLVVRGARTGDGFAVASFTTVRVDGQPVIDGEVVRDGKGLAIRTGTGVVALGNPPAALRDLIGARVWITGALATGPNLYGVIRPANR